MSPEQNKAVVLRYFEESHNRGNLAIIDELCESSYGAERKAWQTMELAAFPDTRFTIEDALAEADRVMLRWTFQGTHRGPFWTPLGTIAPTGRTVRITGAIVYRLEDGRLVEEQSFADWLEMLRQLGATIGLPPLAPDRDG